MSFFTDGINNLLALLEGQIVSIPTKGPLAWVYIIINAVLLLFGASALSGALE